ncbi:TPA: hypothetical protein REW70_004459 [Klebsiella pneumoniae]|nr:hypothetical protein [Klebsiella pneumoniae]
MSILTTGIILILAVLTIRNEVRIKRLEGKNKKVASLYVSNSNNKKDK